MPESIVHGDFDGNDRLLTWTARAAHEYHTDPDRQQMVDSPEDEVATRDATPGDLRVPTASDYLTVLEASTLSRHGVRTVRRWLAERRLPYIRVPGGQKILIRRSDLEDFLNGGRVDPAAPPRGGTP